MNNNFLVIAASVSLFLFLAWPAKQAHAVEVLTAQELASHCQAFPAELSSPDGEYCVRYIQGFIDGAVATDVRVMINIEAETKQTETLKDRALRTRLPNRAERQRAAGYAEFCLGDPVPLAEVVAKVVEDLNALVAAELDSGSARDSVYRSLRKHYPCKAE